MTLADLRVEFVEARAFAVTNAKHTASACPPDTCRYCGKRWLKFAGSKLDGHGACYVTLEFRATVERVWRADPRLTVAHIATALDVPNSWVAIWCGRHASARRAA